MRFIFVVDDSYYKRESIANSMERLYPGACVERYSCVNELLREMKANKAVRNKPGECLVVTDMIMPHTCGGNINSYAGYHVLERLQRFGLEVAAMVVSSEEIDEERAGEAYDHYAGSVVFHYGANLDDEYKSVLEEDFRSRQ